MVILVKLFGALVVFMGLLILVSPVFMRRWLVFWEQDSKLQLALLLRLAIGAILFTASPQCRLPGVILVLGVLSFLSGVIGMILGPERLRSMLRWLYDLSPPLYRVWALFATAVGGLILYAA